jgi:hypothetical protein
VLIDRFESGAFTFVGGHIYFNNDVIKLRYDIIDKFGGNHLEEKDVFNEYDSIFDLNEHEKVKSDTPIDSKRG